MPVKFLDGTEFDDIFNPNKYERSVTPFQTEIGGEIVERKRYLFRKITVKPVRTIADIRKRVAKRKAEKKKDTFIPLFGEL